MANKRLLKNMLKSIKKATDDIKQMRAESYLAPIENKIWKPVASKYIVLFNDAVYYILNSYKNDVVEVLREAEELFNTDENIKKAYKTREYLDKLFNRVVVPDIKDELVELSKRYRTALDTAYEQHIRRGLNVETATLVYQELGMEFNFNKFDRVTSEYLTQKKINWANQVSQTNENLVKRELKKGFEEGLGSYEIADNIERVTGFSPRRSEAIARTEIMSASNYIDYVAFMQDENAIGVWWSATEDDRTRLTHSRLNGQRIKKGEHFIVGGHKMRFPGDSSLGAPASEIINCRCILREILKDRDAISLDSNFRERRNESDYINGLKFRKKLDNQKGMPEIYKQALIDRFIGGTKLAQEVFLKHVPDNSVANGNYTDGAHYNPRTDSIYMSFENDYNVQESVGTDYFHEHGHLIDVAHGLLSRKTNFTRILRMDYENYLKSYKEKYNITSEKDLYKRIQRALENSDTMYILSAISDLLSGLSGFEIEGPFTHDKNYWTQTDYMIGAEAFAHFFEAQFDKDKLKALENHFPLASKVFTQYLEAIK